VTFVYTIRQQSYPFRHAEKIFPSQIGNCCELITLVEKHIKQKNTANSVVSAENPTSHFWKAAACVMRQHIQAPNQKTTLPQVLPYGIFFFFFFFFPFFSKSLQRLPIFTISLGAILLPSV
jgi:hypothetical protein